MGFYHIQGTGRERAHSGHAHKTLGDEDRVCTPRRRPGLELVPKSCLTRVCGCPGQRYFCVFAVSFPGQEALTTIYSTILSQHLASRSAPTLVQRISSQLVASALGKPATLFSPVSNPLLYGADGCFLFSPGKYFISTFQSICFK